MFVLFTLSKGLYDFDKKFKLNCFNVLKSYFPFRYHLCIGHIVPLNWKIILPGTGQAWVLQVCDSLLLPAHGVPPLSGAGLSQRRVLPWVPPPQVCVQLLQDVQLPQLPLTWQMGKWIIWNCWNSKANNGGFSGFAFNKFLDGDFPYLSIGWHG